MRISDWSSDVCSSDLGGLHPPLDVLLHVAQLGLGVPDVGRVGLHGGPSEVGLQGVDQLVGALVEHPPQACDLRLAPRRGTGATGVEGGPQLLHHLRSVELSSEEHTSELQSLMRISYAVFCLKKK